jgi:hypothetical protein
MAGAAPLEPTTVTTTDTADDPHPNADHRPGLEVISGPAPPHSGSVEQPGCAGNELGVYRRLQVW